MRPFFTFIIILALFGGCVPAISAQTYPTLPGSFQPSQKSWKAADKLLKKMSVEEKVGQLIHIGLNAKFANRDGDYFKDIQRQVTDNKIGGVIYFGAPIYE